MARPCKFDIELATEQAMEMFWAKGSEDASLLDLLEGMGIARGSLYKAFNDKRSFPSQAL